MPFHASGIPGEALNAPALRDQESSKPEPTVGVAPLLPRRPAPRVPAIKKPTLRRTGKVRTCHVSPLLLGCSDVSLDKNYVSDESGLLYMFTTPSHGLIFEEHAQQLLSPSHPCCFLALAEQKHWEFLTKTGTVWRHHSVQMFHFYSQTKPAWDTVFHVSQ